jgi:hypothetical protein
MLELRTQSAGAKVTEREYAEIEKLAESRGLKVGEWCRCNGPRSFPRSFQIHAGLDSQILHPPSGGIGYSVVYAKQYPKQPGAVPSWPMVSERSSPSREASPRLGGAPLTAPGRSEKTPQPRGNGSG